MHQRTRKTPQSKEFGENKLRTNQPTQAMCTVLEIIIPGVKVQVFETENFPPFAPDWGRSLSGSCQCNKAAIGVFSPRIPTDIWVQAPWNSPNNNLPTASTKHNEHLTHDLKNAPLWLFLNETSILEWGGVWNSLRYFQSPWNRSEIISQHISSISFLSMRQPTNQPVAITSLSWIEGQL